MDIVTSSITQCNSARMRENTDQNNAEYGHFLPSGKDMSKMTTVRYMHSVQFVNSSFRYMK